MKKIAIGLSVLCCIGIAAQKKKKERYEDILITTDIKKIELFLQTAHPEDPRRTVLKPKLIALKNAAWVKGAKDAKPMAARPIETEIPNAFVNRPNSHEAAEFKELITTTSTAQKEKTVKLLNTLFDQDINEKEAILLVQNNSDCNMIMRIQGKDQFYNLAIPAHGENSIVLNKGEYDLNSNICDVKYVSKKDMKKNMMIMLNNPVVKIQNSNMVNVPAGAKSAKQIQ